MNIEQEPKYDCVDGKIVNRATGVPIPDDEPVFILRAKDRLAAVALAAYYMETTRDPGVGAPHMKVVGSRYKDFVDFLALHPERMKSPDSEYTP